MSQRQVFENYLYEKPLAVSIAHLLNEKPDGMTATELADVLHLSVPTLYRLTLEMYQLKLIKSERKGRKNIFKISSEFKNLLPTLSETLNKLSSRAVTSNNNGRSKFDQVSMAKSILEEYNLPLSPRVAETMIISVLKQKISTQLPETISVLNVQPITTILKEKIRFDIYLGNKKKFVAVEIKIIETTRGLRETIGNLALLNLKESEKKFSGIVVAYIISSMGGKWYISEEEVSEAITSLSVRSNKIFAIISKADRYQIIDSQFLDDFVNKIVEKVKEALLKCKVIIY